MVTKELFGLLAAALTFISYAPYFRSIIKGQTKPHIFTWLIWTLATGVVCAAQYKSGAGAGAWATGFTCFLSVIVTVIALIRGEKSVTRSDWVAFLGSLSAIPVWYVTHEPLPAVILITFIDGVAYFPTLRKSVTKPYEEAVIFYILSNVKHVCTLLAMGSYSLTTTLYPATLIGMNSLLIFILLLQRFLRKKYKGSQ